MRPGEIEIPFKEIGNGSSKTSSIKNSPKRSVTKRKVPASLIIPPLSESTKNLIKEVKIDP
jgi:hypothetical protein